MTSILITGSAGFVAPYLLDELKEHFDGKVYGFDLKTRSDLRDYEAIRTAIDEVRPDYIYHLAAQAYVPEGTTNPQRAFEVNTLGTLNLLEAVRQSGLQPRILVAGTSEEYGYDRGDVLSEAAQCRPTTPYGVSKLAATNLAMVYARMYGMNVVATRAFNHTGPMHPPIYAIPSFAKRVAEVEAGRLKVVRHGNLEAIRNYTDVRDVVRAYRLAIELDPGIYNVCSSASVALKDVLETLARLADVEIPTEVDPALYRPGKSEFPPCSAAKLYEATGWKPEIPIEKTLEDTLNYWREQL